MTKVPVFATVGRAFSDALRAARAMPLLIVAGVIISFGHFLTDAFAIVEGTFRQLALDAALGIALVVLQVPIFIAMLRFFILGADGTRYRFDFHERNFRLFCGWAVAFFVVTVFSSSLLKAFVEVGDVRTAIQILHFVTTGMMVAACALLFPAIAADAPNPGVLKAVAGIRGSFWRSLIILTLVYLPLLVVAFLSYLAFSKVISETPALDTLIGAAVGFCGDLVWAAASARLYLLLANRHQQSALS